MGFYAVVVLYNKKIQESQSIKNLLSCSMPDIYVIVLDNSCDEFIELNQRWSEKLSIYYHAMGGNAGLSKAYNFALELLKEKEENDIVIWFDDDTPIEKKYFEVLKAKAENTQFDVFVPVIYGQDGIIYSPNEVGLLKGKYIKSSNQTIRNDKFNAINSCLAVRMRLYKNYRYDESLFMDCVDMQLFDDFRKKKVEFCVLPVDIHQSFFQRSEDKDVKKYWNRFQIRIKDTVTYSFRGNLIRKISGIIRIYGWAIVYGIKLKSGWFLKKCMLEGNKWIFVNK